MRRIPGLLAALVVTLGGAVYLGACAGPREPSALPPASGTGGTATLAPSSSGMPDASATAVTTAAATSKPEPCGALDCLLFDTPEHAFAHVLANEPLVLAVGEAHAQKDREGPPSAVRRFTEKLLPMLKGRASDLVVELWVEEGKCGKVEQQVATRQKQVTQGESSANQGEFLALATRAKELGIRPEPLRPTCEEYERIAKAGPDDVAEMLAMIARHTAADIKKLLARPATEGGGKMLVAYGGSMHNDLAPPAERKDWSFGPELQLATGGRCVELDLIVPEFIRDTESWRSLPWYSHFDPRAHPERTTLFRQSPGSYALIFPRTK